MNNTEELSQEINTIIANNYSKLLESIKYLIEKHNSESNDSDSNTIKIIIRKNRFDSEIIELYDYINNYFLGNNHIDMLEYITGKENSDKILDLLGGQDCVLIKMKCEII